MRALKEKACGLSFLAFWAFIGLVSAYDGYLVERYRDSIQDMEQNPFGCYLLELDDGDTSLLLQTKAGGTLLVLCILIVIYQRSRRIALPVVKSLAAFQLGLLLYLTLGMPPDTLAEYPAFAGGYESTDAIWADDESSPQDESEAPPDDETDDESEALAQ